MRKAKSFFSKFNFIIPIITLSSCYGLFGKVVTYHKPCAVWKQATDVFKSNDGTVYAFYDWYAWSVFNGNERANDCYYDNRNIHGFASNKDNLFISTTKRGGSLNDCSIVAFDKDMNVIKQIKSGEYIGRLAATDNSLYCLCGFEDDYYLKKYSLDTFQEITIGDIKRKGILEDEGTVIYLSEYHDLFIADSGKHFHGSIDKFDCWDSAYGLIEGQINNSTLKISIDNEICSLMLPYNKTLLYNNVYIQNGYLVFAIREYIEDDDCPLGAEDVCFCHFGRSSLLRFDLLDKDFLEPIEYNHQSILIDYDFDGAQYYYNGALYDKGIKKRDCRNIAIHGTKKMIEGDEIGFAENSDEVLKLIYHDGDFYGI